MKILLILMLLISTTAFAGGVIDFKKGVEFDHEKHSSDWVGICAVCHEQEQWKIANFGKRWAHKNCIDCHDLYKQGPTACHGCHGLFNG